MLATENPIEQEGTFPLPEAQLDRFAIRASLGYPNLEDEMLIVEEQRHVHPLESLDEVLTKDELMEVRAATEAVYVDRLMLRWLVELVRATRQLEIVSVGASVRASLALERVARAWALMHGRTFVDTADIERLFIPVIAHRLVFEPFALAVEGTSSEGSLLDRVQAECLRLAPPPEPAWQEHAGAARATCIVETDGEPDAPRLPSRSPVPDRPASRTARSAACAAGRAPRSRAPAPTGRATGSPGSTGTRRRGSALPRTTTSSSSGEYYAEIAPRVIIVVDRHPSMGLYPSELPWLSKPDVLREAITAIVAAALAARAYVGYLDFAGGSEHDGRRRSGFAPHRLSTRRIMHRLTPQYDASRRRLGVVDRLSRSRLPRDVPAGSFVFVVSDFLRSPPDHVWSRARARNWTSCR